jgi:hypothetical protein
MKDVYTGTPKNIWQDIWRGPSQGHPARRAKRCSGPPRAGPRGNTRYPRTQWLWGPRPKPRPTRGARGGATGGAAWLDRARIPSETSGWIERARRVRFGPAKGRKKPPPSRRRVRSTDSTTYLEQIEGQIALCFRSHSFVAGSTHEDAQRETRAPPPRLLLHEHTKRRRRGDLRKRLTTPTINRSHLENCCESTES